MSEISVEGVTPTIEEQIEAAMHAGEDKYFEILGNAITGLCNATGHDPDADVIRGRSRRIVIEAFSDHPKFKGKIRAILQKRAKEAPVEENTPELPAKLTARQEAEEELKLAKELLEEAEKEFAEATSPQDQARLEVNVKNLKADVAKAQAALAAAA